MGSTLTDPGYGAFVRHLVALRIRLGVTQEGLAARLGKTQSYVSKTERRERRMDPAEFRAFVLAMGADPVAEFAIVSAALSATG